MAGKLKSMVEGYEATQAFRQRYEFPEGVGVSLIGPKDEGWTEDAYGTPFPLIAIVEGGLRFPVHPFLTEVLNHYGLAPIQLQANAYRIILGIAELNRRLNLDLGLYEFSYCYSCVESGGAKSDRKKYHFRARAAQRELVQFLPSSGKGVDDVIVRISGPWEFGNLPEEVLPPLRCPRVPGRIGRSQPLQRGFIL